MSIKRSLLITLLGTLTMTACGDDDDGGSGGPVPFEDYLEVLEQTQCERAVECGLAPDLETCFDTRFPERDGDLASALAAVEAGTATYDGVAAAACNAFLADA